MARHWHARSHDGSVALHSNHRAASGADGRLSRRDRLSLRLHLGRAARSHRQLDEEQSIWSLSAATAPRKGILSGNGAIRCDCNESDEDVAPRRADSGTPRLWRRARLLSRELQRAEYVRDWNIRTIRTR